MGAELQKRYCLQDADGTILAKAYSFKQAWHFMEQADQFGFDVAQVLDLQTGECVMDTIRAQFEGAPPALSSTPRIQLPDSEIPF